MPVKGKKWNRYKYKKGDVIDNMLTIISEPYRRGHNLRVITQCVCGKERDMPLWEVHNKVHINCGCITKRYSKNYTGINELSGAYLAQIKVGAKSRNLEYLVSVKYLWDVFEKQEFKCALTGIPIELFRNWTKKKGQVNTASLDRIDNSKGYIEGNVQWLHKHINKMKMELSDETFIEMCKQVYLHNLKKGKTT